MVKSETVVFNGIEFRRYPESDNPSDRKYYRPKTEHILDGVEALHREVWKEHNGEIPDGHHIHHIDGNPANNNIENLECLSPREHAARHPETGGVQSEEHHQKMIEAAKEWHQSNEGEEWHRMNAKEMWEDMEVKEKDCEQCGETFEFYTSARFCSDACKAKWRRESGRDDVERICEACRQPFTVNKYSDTKTCSRACAGALVSWSKRV